MNTKLTIAAIAAIVSLSSFGVTHAQTLKTDVRANTDIEVKTGTVKIRGNATSTAVKNDRAFATSTRGNATSTVARQGNASSTANTQGKRMSESHRSAVSTFVQSLLAVSNREGGIGTQVRAVAHLQNDSASTTASAMTKVEARGGFHTFFSGSDYKNLNVIRKELATTTANIARLKVLVTQATTDANRTELNVQIKALEDQQAKITAYIKASENKFGLFGWFNKMLAK